MFASKTLQRYYLIPNFKNVLEKKYPSFTNFNFCNNIFILTIHSIILIYNQLPSH